MIRAPLGHPGDSGDLSRTGWVNCPRSVGLVRRISRAKLYPSSCPTAGPSPPKGIREALKRETSARASGLQCHQLATNLLSGWLHGSWVLREHCRSLHAIACGGDACKIIASHPEQADCLALLGLGLLFHHHLSPTKGYGLFRSGKNVAGEETECLQPHLSTCMHSTPVCTGEMGGKRRY